MNLPLPSLPHGINRRHATIGLTILTFIWLWVALDRPYNLAGHVDWISAQYPNSSPKFENDPGDQFDFPTLDSESVRSVCTHTQWNSSLVFTCANSVGGIGNIRNSILNCVRYAIAAGASMVEPQIIVRNAKDTAEIRTGVRTGFEYMFDRDHFYASIAESCPGLIIHKSLSEVSGSLHEPLSILPESLEEKRPRTGLAHPELWVQKFDAWLSEHYVLDGTSKALIDLGRSYISYPIYSDGNGFAMDFGGLLKFRKDIRILGTTTLRLLAQKLEYPHQPLDFKLPYFPSLFMGAHLRTEEDARKGWPGQDWKYSRYETQAELYLNQSAVTGLKDIYVASGEKSEIEKFRHNATAIGATIHTKHSILDADSLATLDALAWDQQGMVDFLILLKASSFAGIGHSSFAWNVALLRHKYAREQDHLSGPQLLNDELSTVYGTPKAYPEYSATLWPRS